MTSREALASKELPKSVIIVGAGRHRRRVRLFLQCLWDSKVTLVEMLPQILPVEDEEVSPAAAPLFEKQGITVHLGTKCDNFRVGKDLGEARPPVRTAKTRSRGRDRPLRDRRVANLDGVLAATVKPELDRRATSRWRRLPDLGARASTRR
jgi:dihydrolipoamide dehydrogenase